MANPCLTMSWCSRKATNRFHTAGSWWPRARRVARIAGGEVLRAASHQVGVETFRAGEQRRGGPVRMGHRVAVAMCRRRHEPTDQAGLLLDQLLTGDQDRGVPVRNAAGVVGEGHPVQGDVVDVGQTDHVPTVEHPHRVVLPAREPLAVVRVADLGEPHLGGISPVTGDEFVHQGLFERAAEGAVGVTGQLTWSGDPRGFQRDQTRGVVLDDRGERHDRHPGGACRDELFGRAHPEVDRARPHRLIRVRTLTGFEEGDLQPGSSVVALLARQVHARVVRVRGPVQHHLDVGGRRPRRRRSA